MTGVFGSGYAAVYDALYGEKDYEAECTVIERLFAAHAGGSGGSVATVLDLGCGTGGHAFPLARRGLRVTGVDRSAAMLTRARAKAAELAAPGTALPDFAEGDIRALSLDRTYDAAIMMFAVLGYQNGNDELAAALSSVRRHLRPSGLFLFDVWYGPAVLHQRPGDRVRTVVRGDERIVRATRPVLDVRAQICRVDFEVQRIVGDRLVGEVRETHAMRFFFERELELALAAAGLRLEALRAFPPVEREPAERELAEREPDETSWTVIGVARAV